MTFIYPQILYLFFLLPILVFLELYFQKKGKQDVIPFGNTEVLIQAILKTKKIDLLKYFPLILKILIISFLILGLARPISNILLPEKDTKIIILLDTSISMEASDIKPTRLDAAKKAAIKFINDLPSGIKIGLVLFSKNVKVLSNLDTDKKNIITLLNNLSIEKLEAGTALGEAILSGVDIIGSTSLKNNFLILITDGESNSGIDPMLAAAQAKIKNISIESIGIGNPLGSIIRGGILTRLDELTLKEISSITNGSYFNAKSDSDFHNIYNKIKSNIKIVPVRVEISFIFSGIALLLCILLQFLRWSKFRF